MSNLTRTTNCSIYCCTSKIKVPSPTNVVKPTLPKDPVEVILELTLVVAVILPATSTDELTVFTDKIEVPLEFSTDKASPLFPLITTVSEPC